MGVTIGWAIIGTGRHVDLRIAPAINFSAEGRLVAVVSRDKGRALEAAHRMRAEKGYSALDEMLRDRDVNAVYICSPNGLHAEQTIRAARAERHVLCEKPMALTVADAQEMVEACHDNGMRLGIGFHLRYHPAHQMVRRLVADGEMGPVTMAMGHWSIDGQGLKRGGWWTDPEMAGGGIIMGTGSHVIDLLRFVLGRETGEVFAFSDTQQPDKQLDVTTLALLRYEDGSHAVLVCSRNFAYPTNNLVIHGPEGRILSMDTLWEGMKGRLELLNRTGSACWEFKGQKPEVDLYVRQIDAFNRCIANGSKPLASGEDGLEVVRITEAILKSARDHVAVRIER